MDKFIKILRVLLVLFFLTWAISWSSIRAYKLVEKGKSGMYSKIIVELYNTPYSIRRWFRSKTISPPNSLKIDTVNKAFKIGEADSLKIVNDSIYLFHFTNGTNSNSQILMQNIKSGAIEKKWKIPLDKILIDLDSIREMLDNSYLNGQAVKNLNLEIPKRTDEISSQHSILLEDGSILFKAAPFGFIYKIDKNSKILWKSKKLANHSIELDENGNIWTSAYNLNNATANKLGYNEDAILCLDQEGNELYFKSLTDIYLENGLFENTVESTPVGYSWNYTYKDPLHLNDVEPVMNDGTYWKKGDVFLSMRNKSLVALFRPETGKIIMQRQGPWLMQHDIDIENDSIISIFNNNVSSLNDEVKTNSNIAEFNLKTNKTKFILNNIFKTKFQGRKTRLRSKDVLIESTMTGLYIMLDSIGKLKYKFYVPYPPDPNFAQIPGWSRVYLKENGIFIEE